LIKPEQGLFGDLSQPWTFFFVAHYGERSAQEKERESCYELEQ